MPPRDLAFQNTTCRRQLLHLSKFKNVKTYIRHVSMRLVAWWREWQYSVRLYTKNTSYIWRTLDALVVFTRQMLLHQPRATSHFTKIPLFTHKSTRQQIILRQFLLSNNTDNQYCNSTFFTAVGSKLILRTGVELRAKKEPRNSDSDDLIAMSVTHNSTEQIHFQKADRR
jgi:hypothetical protein